MPIDHARLRRLMAKTAYAPPSPPPMDPAAMGGMPPGMPPMDPSMMGAPPPGMPPMDPSMMGAPPPGMDPAAMGGMPPMDPSMMGMDPSMMGAPPAGGGQPPIPVMLNLDDLRAVMAESAGQGQAAAPDKTGKRVSNAEIAERLDALEGMFAHLMNSMGIPLPEGPMTLGPGSVPSLGAPPPMPAGGEIEPMMPDDGIADPLPPPPPSGGPAAPPVPGMPKMASAQYRASSLQAMLQRLHRYKEV